MASPAYEKRKPIMSHTLYVDPSADPPSRIQQERVWKSERAAIEERKRTQQLLKEQAEERQIQELQRLGGKKDERVEWLYNAAGASGQERQNEDMEAYLLGKKSVEGLFKKRDEEKVSSLNAFCKHCDHSNSLIPDGSAKVWRRAQQR